MYLVIYIHIYTCSKYIYSYELIYKYVEDPTDNQYVSFKCVIVQMQGL